MTTYTIAQVIFLHSQSIIQLDYDIYFKLSHYTITSCLL